VSIQMAEDNDSLISDFNAFIVELERECPEAGDGLAITGSAPPMLSLRHRVEVLRTLHDNAGIDAFLEAWRSFAAHHLEAIIPDRDT
jgi:hypothetical protein